MKNSVFITGVVATVVLLTACKNNPAPAPQTLPPVAVAVYEASTENATYYDQYPATVTALNEVQLLPQVSGYITGVYFRDGQYVSKGMKLYSIDQQQYRAGVDQSVANLNVAKANLARAQ
ncbi:MAG TPA: biotin/lipoyl-binding protein, partial [Flavisolibacter sp.]|nr:biotin/lipoyl-binding protein [Flavisolibacter sp.]